MDDNTSENNGLPENWERYDPHNMRQAILSMATMIEQGYNVSEAVDLSKVQGEYNIFLKHAEHV